MRGGDLFTERRVLFVGGDLFTERGESGLKSSLSRSRIILPVPPTEIFKYQCQFPEALHIEEQFTPVQRERKVVGWPSL